MAGFDDEEREKIRQQLVESAKENLLQYGPKKTNISDITEPVGIANSTLYLFFDSKAEIYLEIMYQETTNFIDNVDSELKHVDNPQEGFERLCRCYSEFAETNPLVQELIASEYYGTTFRDDLPEERLQEIQGQGMAEVMPYIERLQEKTDGLLRDHEPTEIIGLMSTIGIMYLHKQEFEQYAEGYYEQIRDLLIKALAIGLTTKSIDSNG